MEPETWNRRNNCVSKRAAGASNVRAADLKPQTPHWSSPQPETWNAEMIKIYDFVIISSILEKQRKCQEWHFLFFGTWNLEQK